MPQPQPASSRSTKVTERCPHHARTNSCLGRMRLRYHANSSSGEVNCLPKPSYASRSRPRLQSCRDSASSAITASSKGTGFAAVTYSATNSVPAADSSSSPAFSNHSTCAASSRATRRRPEPCSTGHEVASRVHSRGARTSCHREIRHRRESTACASRCQRPVLAPTDRRNAHGRSVRRPHP